MNILFVCTINKCRSPTAEWLYAKNPEYRVMSAGIDPRCDNPVDEDVLEWADKVFVMERRQRNLIRKRWPHLYQNTPVECLSIPDDYGYMDGALPLVFCFIGIFRGNGDVSVKDL